MLKKIKNTYRKKINPLKLIEEDNYIRILNLGALCAWLLMFSSSSEPILELVKDYTFTKLFINSNSIINNISTGYVVSWLFYFIVVYFPEKDRKEKYINNLQFINNKIFSTISYRFKGFHSADGRKHYGYDKGELLWLIALYNQGAHPTDIVYSNTMLSESMNELIMFSSTISNLSHRHYKFHYTLTEAMRWMSLFDLKNSQDNERESMVKSSYLKILFILLCYEYLKEGNNNCFDTLFNSEDNDLLRNKRITTFLYNTKTSINTDVNIELSRNEKMLDLSNLKTTDLVTLFESGFKEKA